jgi:hypothetical protein
MNPEISQIFDNTDIDDADVCESSINMPKQTNQFKNSLKNNKGSIKINDIISFISLNETKKVNKSWNSRFSQTLTKFNDLKVPEKTENITRFKSLKVNPTNQKFYEDMTKFEENEMSENFK